MEVARLTTRDARRVVLAVMAMATMTAVLIAWGSGASANALISVPISRMTGAFGVSTGVASKVWNAYNSWWSWALSAALLLVGLGGFSALIKAMFKGWVKAYGKKAARQIAIRW